MECTVARDWMLRRIDAELSPAQAEQLENHLGGCLSCTRELSLLTLPRRIGRGMAVPEPSPYFYTRLRANLESEKQSGTIWTIILGLSRRVVPSLAAITLVLMSLFFYFDFRDSGEVYQAYDHIFISGDRPQRMIIADSPEITDESVLLAISEQDNQAGAESKPADNSR
jgi:hypothetical protein